MNKQEIESRYVMLEEIHDQLEEHRKQFISVIRGNKAFYKPAIKFTEKIEEVLSWYQMELMSVSVELIKEIKSGRQLIMIMELYGIDPGYALSSWNKEKLEREHSYALQNKEYRVPEKIREYIDWEKIARHNMEQMMNKLIADHPHLERMVKNVFLEEMGN